MSAGDAPPTKAVADPESYREALDGWMKTRLPGASGLRVHDVDMPRATGFSNETVFFRASWREGGTERTQRFVARIEPPDGGLFPVQAPGCEVSVEVQYRIMKAVAEAGIVPMPVLVAYEGDRAVLGRPFFVMEFIEGVVPADVPRYSQAGFLVDEATPAERERKEMSATGTRIDWPASVASMI